jgi:hypothetical protein
MKRASFFSLCGEWDLFVGDREFLGKITVPFVPESRISGIGRSLKKGEKYLYRKSFYFSESLENKRLLLHFGAVDQIAEVWLNGELIGDHIGGYLPFVFDITDKLTDGENILSVTVTDELETGNRVIEFEYDGDVYDRLKQLGEVPLPPYIKEKLDDPERYQTVYSKAEGSVAAPTAGLHFTPELLEKIKAKGIKVVSVTLHVGIGTFRPVKVDVIEEHKMHSEYYILPQSTADVINQTKKDGGKVIAVGTTACRVLETAGRDAKGAPLSECCGETDIFIYPGFKFTVIDNLITNFHLP